MPTSVPVLAVSVGQTYTDTMYNSYVKDNINKLLNLGHRTLTVAQFAALSSPEGTKGVVAGDEVYLEVDAANGILWHLVYESTETTYKWRFLGGPPMYAEVATNETSAGGAVYSDTTTVGPSLSLPRGGDYDLHITADLDCTTGAVQIFASPKLGAATAVDADCVEISSQAARYATATRTIRRTALASAATIKLQTRAAAGNSIWQKRTLAITPARII